MAKEIESREEVSATISRKLDKMDTSEEIKRLLRQLLNLELEHRNERAAWYGYKDEYETIIREIANKEEAPTYED